VILTHEELDRLIIEISAGIPPEESQVVMTDYALEMRAKLEEQMNDIKAQGFSVGLSSR
jgi:hypothetical protein